MRGSSNLIVILILVALLALAAFIAVSFNAASLRKSFRNEMAQRLDLEEKLSKIGRERESLIKQLGTLSGEMDKTKAVVKKLQSDLTQVNSNNSPEADINASLPEPSGDNKGL